MASQAVSIASALVSGPTRMLNYAAAGTAMLLASEVGLRGCLTLSHVFTQWSLPKNYQFEEQNEFSKKYVDFRQLTRKLDMKKLGKALLIATVSTMVLTEVTYRLFGAPIKGINMFGRLIGIQGTNKGIYENLNFSDWRSFAHQPV